MKYFARALAHYGWPTIKELKGRYSLTFHSLVESVGRFILKSTISFPEAMESQGRGSTATHHLTHGGQGLAAIINILSA